jgi:uncharacterized membrane protein
MSDIAVTLTSNAAITANIQSGATIAAEIIATGPQGPAAVLPVASADVLGGIKVGANLKITDGVLSVDTATDVQQDNTRPVTSGAVYVELGNIEALLAAL